MGKNYNSSRLVNGLSVDASGNVGVGNSPNASYKLTVTGTSLYTGALTANNTINTYNSTGNYYLSFYDTSSSNKNWGIIARGNNIAIREAGVNDHMTFLAGGSVLIGTTSTAVGGILSLNGDLKFGGTAGGNYSIINYQGGYLAFGTDNTERMRISTSGNVGIGTSSPNDKLVVDGGNNIWTGVFRATTTTSQSFGMQIFAGTNSSDTAFRILNGATTSTYLMVRGDGNVGIGTGTPRALLDVRFNADRGVRFSSPGVSTESVIAGYQGDVSNNLRSLRIAADNLYFNTGDGSDATGTQRMVIQSYGRIDTILSTNNTNTHYIVHSGTSPYGINITFSGAAPVNETNNFLYFADASTSRFVVYSSGATYNRTGTFGTLSDISLKENIVDATPKLEDILKLKVRNFNIKGVEEKQIGFIAQEFEEVFPNLVDITNDKETNEELKAIKTSVLVPMLVKAIQELKGENDELRSILTRNNLQ